MTDQNGTVHAYERDKLGRLTADRVTSLGTGVDGAVREIATTYEVRGMVEKITSRDGAGAVVNEVQNEFNGLGQLTKQHQSHAGAVTSGTPFVEYTYDHSASGGVFTKGARSTSTIYPTTSQERALDYGPAGGAGDKLSRVETISDGDERSCRYGYLGLRTFVTVEYRSGSDVVASLRYDPLGDRGYAGWDQYTRIIDHHWLKPGEEPETLDRFQYGYDANSNRLYKANLTAQALDKPFDELYRYDQVNRLIDFERGRLNEGNTSILGMPAKEQTWDLDATGNWSRFTSADDGSLETDQTRLHNEANEITQMSSWFPPAYDHAGNMVKMPKPEAPSEGFVCTYDAWNRLVRAAEADECGCAAEIVSEYQYGGQTWRTTAIDYEDGSPSETRHFYYSSEWQILEERVGSLLTPERTHLWGLRYIDEIIHRWRDTDESGTLDESLWALQDANWNVTARCNHTSLTSRAVYLAYGSPQITDIAYNVAVSPSASIWNLLAFGWRIERWGVYHVRMRVVNPTVGIWLSRDPLRRTLRDAGLYEFLRANPYHYLDPSGLQVIMDEEWGSTIVPQLLEGTALQFPPGKSYAIVAPLSESLELCPAPELIVGETHKSQLPDRYAIEFALQLGMPAKGVREIQLEPFKVPIKPELLNNLGINPNAPPAGDLIDFVLKGVKPPGAVMEGAQEELLKEVTRIARERAKVMLKDVLKEYSEGTGQAQLPHGKTQEGIHAEIEIEGLKFDPTTKSIKAEGVRLRFELKY